MATTRSVVVDSLAVAGATGAYGVSFGAIAVTAGLSVPQACALSLLVFTGASQFALVGVIAGGGAPLLGAVSGLLLGARNTLYGVSLAPLLPWRGARRAAASHLVIDESTAMALAQDSPERSRLAFLVTGIGIFLLWNLTTLGGALAGEAIGDPRRFGLDAAVGAAFLALLWPRLAQPAQRRAALVAVIVAVILVPLTPAGVPVLVAGIVAMSIGWPTPTTPISTPTTPPAPRRHR